MSNSINVVIKKPFQQAECVTIENTLETFQKIVDGYIEIVHMPFDTDLLAVVNEEGLLRRLDFNFYIGNEIVAGNVVFVRSDGEEFTSLTDSDIKKIKKLLN